MERQRFPIRLGRWSRPFLLLWGVTPGRAWVDVDGAFEARFGFFRFRVPREEIVAWRIEGPFRWLLAIGVRRSLRGGDITFGGSTHGAVRVDFRRPVRWWLLRVPALYVTVDDVAALGAHLASAGIPGADAREPGERPSD